MAGDSVVFDARLTVDEARFRLILWDGTASTRGDHLRRVTL